MKASELTGLYRQDGLVGTVTSRLSAGPCVIRLKGLQGSLDAVVSSAIALEGGNYHVFILHDKEEASYFLNDLQQLNPDREPLFFPTSYKKPYSYEETENANVLMRAEALNRISSGINNEWLVTYPDALTEKVINKRSLVANTFSLKTGEKLDASFLEDFLSSYEFEKTDFVYEAGQYAIRGGIIDVFSYSNELPYRIELFGDEVESIRVFDPQTQLSTERKQAISLIPNVQTRLLQETRESLLDYLPANTVFWFKDAEHAIEVLSKNFDKASLKFDSLVEQMGGNKILTSPDSLFEDPEVFEKNLSRFACVEMGTHFYLKETETFNFESKAQPSFNKEFNMLAEDLKQHQEQGYSNIIVAESYKQVERLTTIFEELDPFLKFQSLNISLRAGFVDKLQKMVCYTEHQIFDRFHRYKSKERQTRSKALTIKELRSLHPGDYVTHEDHGIARFAGLEVLEFNSKQQEAIRLVFRDDDLMCVSVYQLHKISKYSGKEGGPPQMTKLGSGDWDAKKSKVKKQVKDIAKELISLYAKRKAAPGFQYTKDGFLQAELESSFMYEDTPDQSKATADVKVDMEQPHPMDRLVCGDVGFGKTEVAIRAAFKAACDGKQVAVMVPTTILAMQHYKTFHQRLKNFPVIVEYVNRFKSTAQIKETLKRVAEGKTNILIGTHRLISKDVQFKDLGLLIIDEEQKFGVKVKEKLREMKVNVDTLTLTATPIPRTLHFSLMGARDLSIIATPPPNRQPVTTEVSVFSEELIRDAIMHELKRNGQVFFVHNRIKDIESLGDTIKRLVPDARIGVAHGQMEGEQLEKVMMGFVEHDFDVLISTNIIESGLDIPNANTMIIHHAHMFGLSDLHQMRGRVGRSNIKAFCYLLTPNVANLPSDSRKRLAVLEEFSELGDGFKVAMRDLDIRGAGNLLGAEQSGFINDVGFDMYHKILDEAINELKETDFKELFSKDLDAQKLKALLVDCVIESDLSIIIPEKYVSNISERLSLYSTLDNLQTPEDLEAFRQSMLDRFGPMPAEVQDLVQTVKLRWAAEKLGFEKLSLKQNTLKGYFVPGDREEYYKSEIFGRILQYVQAHSKKSRLKELSKKLILVLEDIKSVDQALETLENIAGEVPQHTS